ncbi:MAG: PEP-CTERM sorting domain-containing protein [Planctomycetota bacterium]
MTALCALGSPQAFGAPISIGPRTDNFIAFDEDTVRGVGQSFTIASTTAVQSFSFEAQSTADTVDYRAYIYGWNSTTNENTSTQFFAQGSTQSITSNTYTPLVVETPGLELMPGEYIALLYTTDTAGTGQAFLGAVNNDTYTEGEGFFTTQVRDPETPASFDPSWSSLTGISLEDFVFELVVPEPASAVLLAGAVLALASRRRRI